MQLARFLNKIFKKDGFILTDANTKDYIIGNPGNNPIKLKILNKKLHYKLLFHPDLYFGEAYTDGEIIIENGTLTDFLDLALMNFGRGVLRLRLGVEDGGGAFAQRGIDGVCNASLDGHDRRG